MYAPTVFQFLLNRKGYLLNQLDHYICSLKHISLSNYVHQVSYSKPVQYQLIELKNVNLYQNQVFDLLTENTTTNILNSIIHGNVSGLSGMVFNGVNWFSIDYSLLQDAGNYAGLDGVVIGSNVSPSIPYIIDDAGHLDPVFSPCIDAGHPNDHDECIVIYIPGLNSFQNT